MRVPLLSLLLLLVAAVAWPAASGAQATVCAGHPKDPSVVCARDEAHTVDICDRAADGHRAYARVVTKSTYPAYRSPCYDANDSKEGCSNLHLPSQVVSIQTCVQTGPGHAKPRVNRVVFYYRRHGRVVARSDRHRPYRRTLPIQLASGPHHVYARVYYQRVRGGKVHRRTVKRRFTVCA